MKFKYMKRLIRGLLLKLAKKTKFLFYLDYQNTAYFDSKNKFKIRHVVLKNEYDNLEFFNYHYTNSMALGPLQKDEAMFLFSYLKCTKPKTVLELGFNLGHSALAILNAIDSDCIFKTVDINPKSEKIFKSKFSKKFRNAEFILDDMSMVDFEKKFGQNTIDFIFFDAVHDLEVNIRTFHNLKHLISKNCIIMIHDTGVWHRNFMHKSHFEVLAIIKHKWLDDNIVAHQIDERKFANFLMKEHGFQSFNIHSSNVLRHGITILNRHSFYLDV